MQILITNDGPHPASKWADVTANAILNLIIIEPTAPPDAAAQKASLAVYLRTTLMSLHDTAQKSEDAALSVNSSHINASPDFVAYADQAVGAIQNLTVNSLFEPHFRRPDVMDYVRTVCARHFLDSMDIQRKWFADKNPTDVNVIAYRNAGQPIL